jgi:tetratricopeptide (TPR) repeat protein
MNPYTHVLGCLALLLLFAQAPIHARDLKPTHGGQVLARLAPRLNAVPGAPPEQVMEAAQQAISLARSTTDPRHLGRAQALLAPWWDRPDAPVHAAVLQATVEQAQHRFGAARASLQRALAREPGQAQAWLTLATLDRLEARYDAAARACERVAAAGAVFHARACQIELDSLRGQHAAARAGFGALVDQSPDADTQAWVYSLLGESEARVGRPVSAEQAFMSSLKLAPDVYTSLAMADLMLETRQPGRALDALKNLPLSDAVLMRQALARRLNNDAQWKADLAELEQRFVSSRQRGDDQALHAREHAWTALHLQTDPQAAQRHALVNLTLQKEPIDWWLALRSTRAAADANTWRKLRAELEGSGLRDARLDALLAGWKP